MKTNKKMVLWDIWNRIYLSRRMERSRINMAQKEL